jgi:hypothetical protein
MDIDQVPAYRRRGGGNQGRSGRRRAGPRRTITDHVNDRRTDDSEPGQRRSTITDTVRTCFPTVPSAARRSGRLGAYALLTAPSTIGVDRA